MSCKVTTTCRNPPALAVAAQKTTAILHFLSLAPSLPGPAAAALGAVRSEAGGSDSQEAAACRLPEAPGYACISSGSARVRGAAGATVRAQVIL